MTFALLRAGFPNSTVAIALAVVPFVALALTPAQRLPHAPVQGVQMIMAAAGDTIVSGDQAVAD
jgi:hypothetical protein